MLVECLARRWVRGTVLVIVLLLSCTSVDSSVNLTRIESLSLATTCMSERVARPTYGDRLGLSPMIKMAAAARSSLSLPDLPLHTLRESFALINDSITDVPTSFSAAIYSAGIRMAAKTLYTASFVLVLGVSVPSVLGLLMWLLPRICSQPAEEGGEEPTGAEGGGRDPSGSVWAQAVLWALGLGVAVTGGLAAIFLALALVGTGWISSGVALSTAAATGMLPELSGIQDNSAHLLNQSFEDTMSSYEQFMRSKINDSVSELMERRVDGSINERITLLRNDVDRDLTTLRAKVLPAMLHVVGNTSALLSYHRALGSLQLAMRNLSSACRQLPPPSPSSSAGQLAGLCAVLLAAPERFSPALPPRFASRLQPLLSALRSSYLPPVQLLAGSSVGSRSAQAHVRTMATSAWLHLMVYFDQHSSIVRTLLVAMTANISRQFESVNLHLPSSQDNIQAYLGPQLVGGWDALRWGLSSAVLGAALGLVLGMLLCSARGLLCAADLHRSSRSGTTEHATELAAAHSALTLARLTYFLFLGYFLLCVWVFAAVPLSTTLAQTCGASRDFGGLTDHFLDSPEVWKGKYPLGSLLLGNHSAPLTLSSMKDTCNRGGSLYEAYQFDGFYPFSLPSKLREEMVDLIRGFSSFSAPLPSILEANISEGMNSSLHLPMDWYLDLEPVRNLQSVLLGNHSQVVMETVNLVRNLSDAVGRGGVDGLWQPLLASALNTSAMILAQLDRLTAASGTLEREITNDINDEVRGWGDYQDRLSRGRGAAAEVGREFSAGYQTALEVIAGAAVAIDNHYLSLLNLSSVCSTGECKHSADLLEEFAGGLCRDVLDGLDLLWSSLMAVLLLLLPLMACTLALSRRLTYQSEVVGQSRPPFTDMLFGQLMATLWYLLSACAVVWLSVAVINSSSANHCLVTGSECCRHCSWLFGLLLVSVSSSVLTAVPIQAYLCYLLYRIRECKFVRTSKYWVKRHSSISFYLAVFVLIVQDAPTAVLAAIFMGVVNRVQVAAVAVITMATIDFVVFAMKIVQQRKEVPQYWKWLRTEVELKSDWMRKCTTTPTPQAVPPGNRHALSVEGLDQLAYEMALYRTGAPPSSRAATPVPPYEESFQQRTTPPGPAPSQLSPRSHRHGHPIPPIPPSPGPLPHRGPIPSINSSSVDSFNSLHQAAHLTTGAYPHPVHSDMSSEDLNGRRPRPSSVLVLDQVLDHTHVAMARRQLMGLEARRQGGVDIAAPPSARYDSSTLHGSSFSSLHTASEAPPTSSSLHPSTSASLGPAHYTSGEESWDHWGGSRKYKMRKKMSFSGEFTMDV